LKLDDSGTKYYEIGDKQAIEKTSQALREGQSKIRQLLRRKSEEAVAFSPEQYFAYSVKVLASLYSEDKNPDILNTAHMQVPPPPLPKQSRKKKSPQMPPLPQPETTNIAVKMALDQFPMASPNLHHSKTSRNMAVHFDNQVNTLNQRPMPAGRRAELASDSASHYSDISMASLSTISAIHTISSEQSGEKSLPKGSRGSFDTLVTSQSHQHIYETEKHFYGLDFIDEAKTFEEASCMEESVECGKGTKKLRNCSNLSLMDESVAEFSVSSSSTNEMIDHLLGLTTSENT
jgi:hypothetical protein